MKKILLLSVALPTITFAQSIDVLEKKFNMLASEVQQLKETKSSKMKNKLTIGGYGEIIYTNKKSKNESDNSVKGNEAKVDTLRHVVVLGYQFDPKWNLMSEIEIEHANSVYTEFLYLDYNKNDHLNFRAGLLPIPMGILNTKHEPTTFFSVNRPETEKIIMPTTWRENGLGIYGSYGDFAYSAYLVNSLKGSSFTDSSVRSGRQKGSKANADNHSYIGTINWSGISDLTLGAGAYIGEVNDGNEAHHNIYEVHGEWTINRLKLKALYTRAFIDAKTLNERNQLSGDKSIGQEQEGGYVEAGYELFNKNSESLVVFSRYEMLNTQKKVPSGFKKNKENEKENITIGLNYKPMDQIVFKADYIVAKNKAKTGTDSINMGMGWNF